MSDRIFKYTLHDHGVALIDIPAGSRFIHVEEQATALQLWAIVDQSQMLEGRCIAVLYTGFDEVPDGAHYIGTVLSHSGNIVRHVFELPKK